MIKKPVYIVTIFLIGIVFMYIAGGIKFVPGIFFLLWANNIERKK